MKVPDAAKPQGATPSTPQPEPGLSPWQRLKSKRISYLTLPLLLMATVTEFVILATGWRYQQAVCLPQHMGVIFFGIGPIGATILAVELLKLPLAIWTASRRGWQKGFMLVFGLPLICLLTFQLVKDMAVYEMGIAMTPATQMLDKGLDEEVKIGQLNGELAAIEQKKADHQGKLAELDQKEAKAKADIEDALKRNDESRTDAITLTDYQKKELSEVSAREATIIQQFDADDAQINKSLAELRAARETALSRASQWNAEEARLDNEYQAKMIAYTNQKTAYEKEKAAYDKANFLKRQFMKTPVDPGVPPERDSNTILKPGALVEIDQQIKAKQDELDAVNTKRRDRIAQVEADARRLRDEFDHRSTAKRDEADHKRDELLAAEASLAAEWKAERQQLDQDLAASVQKVDAIRAQVDTARKNAEQDYQERETDIRKTQVHRIATTVEIVRGWIKGERPASIKASAKERGDILTDQISMVRIWVYPVLAFIVAFLPTLLVEIGFSTVFQPEEEQRPRHRIGFLGRRLHWLYIRAGRQKILRAQRKSIEASAQLASRDRALATAKADAEKALAEKDADLQAARESVKLAAARTAEQLQRKEEEHAAHFKHSEAQWVAKLAGMADSLNRTVIEKDGLRDLQKSEVERQIQLRQNAWSERLTQMNQELESQRAAGEKERVAMMQEHQKKLLAATEESKAEVRQARRHAAETELAAMETSARLNHDLKDALEARDAAEAQLRSQADAVSLIVSQAKEEAARELEKALRQERHRFDRQQLEFGKTLRLREEELERQLKQREQELTIAFEARLAGEQAAIEQDARRRETELQRQMEARALEADARWKQDAQKREEAQQIRLTQREQQWQVQADARVAEAQTQAEQELRRAGADFERQLEAKLREAGVHFKQESQHKELAFHARLKQREQELALAAETREAELQNQWRTDLRGREEAWERQTEARVAAAEARMAHETRQHEEIFQARLRQNELQWQAKLDATRADLKTQTEEIVRQRQAASETALRELGDQLREEMLLKEQAAQAKAQQRERELEGQMTARAEVLLKAARAQWKNESDEKIRAGAEPLKASLARAERERDEARRSSFEYARQVEALEKKLSEASMFFTTWRHGNGNGNGNGHGQKVLELS